MRGVLPVLANEFQHWQPMLAAGRGPGDWRTIIMMTMMMMVAAVMMMMMMMMMVATVMMLTVIPIAKTELVWTDMLVTLEGTVLTSNLTWITTW